MSRRRGRGRGNSAPGAGAATVAPGGGVASPLVEGDVVTVSSPAVLPVAPPRYDGAGRNGPPRRAPRPRPSSQAQSPAVSASVAVATASADGEPTGTGNQKASCTLAQMRRFIKSRPYVPVHELRRRFLIEGIEDEMSPMATGKSPLYVGLPPREAGFLGELVRGGEVGCELLLDPTSPAIIGVYPMRPVARQ